MTPCILPPARWPSRRAARAPTAAALAVLLLATAAPAIAASLEIVVEGIASTHGSLRVAIYDSSDRFMKDAVTARTVTVAAGTAKLRFDGLAPGEYAVAVHHDLDGNGRVDTNLLGIPTEPTAFSGTPSGMGPPSWNRARFALTEPGTTLQIRFGR